MLKKDRRVGYKGQNDLNYLQSNKDEESSLRKGLRNSTKYVEDITAQSAEYCKHLADRISNEARPFNIISEMILLNKDLSNDIIVSELFKVKPKCFDELEIDACRTVEACENSEFSEQVWNLYSKYQYEKEKKVTLLEFDDEVKVYCLEGTEDENLEAQDVLLD